MWIKTNFVQLIFENTLKNTVFGGHLELRQCHVTAREYRLSYRIPRSI